MENIGKLAEALSKAQGEMKMAIKDSANPFFKSSYADLASVWNACRDVLSKNGLAVVQTTEIHEGSIVLKTTLMHSSGEAMSGVLPILVGDKATSQQLGSAITYNRRYALAAMVGVAPEDDDGQSASETQGKTKFQKTDKPIEVKETPTQKWAKEFAVKIDNATSEKQLNAMIADALPQRKKLSEENPEWFERLSMKINQVKEAFRLADAAE